MDPRQEVRSLKKGLRALAFINVNGPANVTAVARALGTPRSTSHRLLETLVVEGYLVRDDVQGVYRLTCLVQQLALGFHDEAWIERVARPVIARLGRELLWPVALTTPRVDQVVVRVATDHDTTLVIERYIAGFSTPILHATSGLCYLAFCSASEREAILDLVQHSSDDRQALAKNRPALDIVMEKIRHDGYSLLEYPQYREGSLGVPVIVNGVAIGGVVMRYIKSALRRDRLVNEFLPRVRAACAEIASGCLELEQGAKPEGGARLPAPIEPSPRRTIRKAGKTATTVGARATVS